MRLIQLSSCCTRSEHVGRRQHDLLPVRVYAGRYLVCRYEEQSPPQLAKAPTRSTDNSTVAPRRTPMDRAYAMRTDRSQGRTALA